ncbi:hypothetical protein [Gynuella sunshinyii]|uniref:Putative kinase n=1 Tax=Gynuella sunshinyii YC6258 TaxID=1445510 RepID=A0A0C5V2Z7_9GAMM|nr:hypothetical protein [Gynuella sunshinyii]AJQ93895.1 putative kinase [Gynuella sunshinyii YC6258]
MTNNPATYGNVSAMIDPDLFSAMEPILQQGLQHGNLYATADTLYSLLAREPLTNEVLTHLGAEDSGSIAELIERLMILQRCYPALQAHKNSLNIQASLLPETFICYLPLARFIALRSEQIQAREQRAAVIGINGSQGSGKTTINAFLQIILTRGFGKNVAGFSIDDVYKTYHQRQQMAAQVHPLFAIRSVPGTHDTQLALTTIRNLMFNADHQSVPLPQFDKMARHGAGDRLPESLWPVITGKVDVVLFEGWCVGATPQNSEDLTVPVNQREKTEDADGTWRQEVNRQLSTTYQELFELLDDLLVIQVRSMEDVYRNRELQEQHLRQRLQEAIEQGRTTTGLGAMNPEKVVAFIGLYERITRHMLTTLADEARATLFIGDHHRIERMRVNLPSERLRGHSARPLTHH